MTIYPWVSGDVAMHATHLKDKIAQPDDQLFILVTRRQLLVTPGDRAPLEHCLKPSAQVNHTFLSSGLANRNEPLKSVVVRTLTSTDKKKHHVN